MRVVFIGAVNIGWQCLKALLQGGANVVGIFTADKQAMVRKSAMHPDYFSDFSELAEQYHIPLVKLPEVGAPLDVEKIKRLEPDIIFCLGWPQILKKEVLKLPPCGCIGIHPTLLPERRGGAPINWCLIDGLSRSGVTLFYFDEGVDSGDIIAQREFEITLEDSAKTVLDKVTDIAVRIVKEYYPLLERGTAPRIPQDDAQATYTRRRRPEQGIIDWSRTSLSIYNWVRALSLPFPGAFTYWNGRKVTIWESELVKGYRPRPDAQPGEIIDSLAGKGVVIATGDSCILVRSVGVQDEDGFMSGDEFIKRFSIVPGAILASGK